jgi:hypothetical protein
VIERARHRPKPWQPVSSAQTLCHRAGFAADACETDVDEADIGRVQVGQEAIFTVDAFPGREFLARVLQILARLRVSQNVVTYTVLVSADNPTCACCPG